MHYVNIESITFDKLGLNDVEGQGVRRVASVYPFRLSPAYARLLRRAGDPVWRQCVPEVYELEDCNQLADPLAEAALSPVPFLIHRYPDRVVLLVSDQCPVYCRFCMRKRMVGQALPRFDAAQLDRAVEYIRTHSAIRDVILSGGDPLMLDDASLELILGRLASIPHVAMIRIGSRMPVTAPERITPELCALLKKFHPLYVNTHFNHPQEITDASARACELLADAGIPLGNQTVLLRGVNDDVDTMRQLMTGLLAIRVRPYYLHQMDLVRGTAHFRTPLATGLDILRGLRGFVSGMAVPHFVIDLPEGKGKVPIVPDGVERDGDLLWLTTYSGERVAYRDLIIPQG